MIYEIIVLDSETMQAISGYSQEGELDIDKIVERTGLVSLINMALNQITNKNINESEHIVSLKTGESVFSFKVSNKIIISIRGTSEKENKETINKLIKDFEIDKKDVLKLNLEDAINKRKNIAEEFSNLWG
ncbi:MAG: hypothetical protein ACTSQY_01745 [Candidatus Odinarchaeia archaeon]